MQPALYFAMFAATPSSFLSATEGGDPSLGFSVMEDALSLNDALDAALRYRVVRTPDGVVIQPGTADDYLLDIEQAEQYVRVSLERGDEIETDESAEADE